MTPWIVRDRESGEIEMTLTDGGQPPYDPELFEVFELPREIDDTRERWDFEAGAIVLRATPEQAAAEVWKQAKAYRDQRQQEPLPIPGIVTDDVIIAERDERGQKWIDRFTAVAGAALAAGEDFSITFTDYVKRPFTLDALQILKLSAASVAQQALCHDKCRAIEAQLNAAVEAGATAAEILEIDITAGYPTDPVSPPLPPSEPES